MATIDEFAKITKKIIVRDGFDHYLPTALYPARKQVVVLEGAPAGSNLEGIVVTWATRGAVGDEEFLVAFKIGPTTFKVIRRYSAGKEEAVFEVPDEDA